MWIQVRSMDGKTSHRVDDLSKLTKIEELREVLVDKFNIPVKQQRLFYRGKQLEDGHTLFDYDVGLNDIVQILARQLDPDQQKHNSDLSSEEEKDKLNKENKPSNQINVSPNDHEKLSKYFKVGDLIDAKDSTYGAWFEAKIIAIGTPADKNEKQVLQSAENSISTLGKDSDSNKSQHVENDGLIYKIIFEDYEDSEDSLDLELNSIRPRARKMINFNDVKEGDFVMVNYNIEEPGERGFWYDCEVTGKKQTRTKNELIVTLIMGPAQAKLEKCRVKFIDEIFVIEKNVMNGNLNSTEAVTRIKMPKCTHCKDIPTKKCKICSCHICGGKDSPEKQIMCDECDLPFHIWCLDPPLSQIPEADDWYCPDCKNDETEVVRAGEKLKSSKKKSKMASANSSSSRDWGKGMACVGRTKECTIVPPNHFGPIPGVEVGTMWKFRLQASECGVHRPHVAGIHGRENEGAYSIVLSGGYEDDLDDGNEFFYTGSGGRDLSGNKRCAEQSCDQTLTRMNKALAVNCNAPLNKKGAEATEWKEGKPVRVVRNCKGRKHSKYSPEEGNRYDGIYKIVKYWPEKGKAGFLVWRYLLRRDDPAPAPWTNAGKKRMKELGLEMQYPEGYLESVKEKEKALAEATPKKKSKKKREHSDEESSPPKKKKRLYQLPSNVKELIDKDSDNQKLWEDCLICVKEGQQEFLKKVEVSFQCICCQEIVYQPITTSCLHNICKICLKRSFSAKVYTCPMCRNELEETIVTKVNRTLQNILLALYPGYNSGR